MVSPRTSYANSVGIPDGFGFILIGGLLSAMLYGITILQTYVYCMYYSEDGLTVKFLVAAIWILDTLQVSSVCHVLYFYLITNYGVPTSLNYSVWSLPTALLVNVFVVSVVQCFFARQIYCLCRPRMKWLVTAPIIILVLVHVALSIEIVALMFISQRTSTYSQVTVYAVIPSLVAAALTDVLIMVSLCILFYDGSSGSSFPRTKRLLKTLIIYTVNRCLLTLLFAIAELVTSVDYQDYWALGLDFIVGKLYANSLLASLNSREHLRSQAAGTLSDLCVSAVHFANPPRLPRDIESSKDRAKRCDIPEMAVIDITTDAAVDKTTVL